jgi:hypothetical protein
MSHLTLSDNDREQIKGKGISEELLLEQLEKFKKGSAPVNLVRAATPGDGIKILSEDEMNQLIDYFSTETRERSLVKFVPASGAASRMFKTLLAVYNSNDEILESDVEKKAETGNTDYIFVREFIYGIKKQRFAFYPGLKTVMEKEGLSVDALVKKGTYKKIIKFLLNDCGLNYANSPKGLIDFHRKDGQVKNPFEEHLLEGMAYGRNENGDVSLHFTISPQFEEAVRECIDTAGKKLESGETRFIVGFSEQKTSTDTAAVDMQNEFFRDNAGALVFRPGGHGALIENLGELTEDIIFIKNIDNVVHERLIEETIRYKKALAGYLMKTQAHVFCFLETLSGGDSVTEAVLHEIAKYSEHNLNISLPGDFDEWTGEGKKNWLFGKLNRPMRVCGMVVNEGEPGGGPFWVEKDGDVSLQIIEGAQIDKNSEKQLNILKSSTHFNPVDLVVGIKDYQGDTFYLKRYVAHDTYFVSEKSMDGRPLKALELPGLWNGAMHDWITIFVEVPIITFNPVKTVNDLLRREHQDI